MPRRQVAERATFVSAVLGIAMGALFLFAPIQGYCMTTATATAPGATMTPGPTICGMQSLIEAQPVWPMPLIAIVLWSIAPLLGYVGVRRRLAGQAGGTTLMAFALVLEATVLVSFGDAPFFAPFVLLPLAITTAIALASRPFLESA